MQIPLKISIYRITKFSYLAFAGKDVEDKVAAAGAELDALGVEDLLGELGAGHDDQVADAHAKEEHLPETLGHAHKVAVVHVITDLEPVAHDWGSGGSRRKPEPLTGELCEGDGEHRRSTEAQEGLL